MFVLTGVRPEECLLRIVTALSEVASVNWLRRDDASAHPGYISCCAGKAWCKTINGQKGSTGKKICLYVCGNAKNGQAICGWCIPVLPGRMSIGVWIL